MGKGILMEATKKISIIAVTTTNSAMEIAYW